MFISFYDNQRGCWSNWVGAGSPTCWPSSTTLGYCTLSKFLHLQPTAILARSWSPASLLVLQSSSSKTYTRTIYSAALQFRLGKPADTHSSNRSTSFNHSALSLLQPQDHHPNNPTVSPLPQHRPLLVPRTLQLQKRLGVLQSVSSPWSSEPSFSLHVLIDMP